MERLGRLRNFAEALFVGKKPTKDNSPKVAASPVEQLGPHPVREDKKPVDPHLINLAGLYIGRAISQAAVLASDPLFANCEPTKIAEIMAEPDLAIEDRITALSVLALAQISSRKRRILRKFEHELGKKENGNNENGGKRKREITNGQLGVAQKERLDAEPKDLTPIRRGLVIEKIESRVLIKDGDEAMLLKEIRRSGSEIPEAEVLKMIAYLQTSLILELKARYRKRVKSGPFKGYHEVGRGKIGRLLFYIDSGDNLHLRLAGHDHIYGAGKIGGGKIKKGPTIL